MTPDRIATAKRVNRRKKNHRIIPRSDWGARAPKSAIPQAKGLTMVVGHHTASSMPSGYHEDRDRPRPYRLKNRTLERQALREVQNYHMDSRGWNDIAYQYVIFGTGRIYRGRGAFIGAHADGFNSTSIGVCFYGNFATVDRPDPEAIDAWVWLINHLQKQGRLTEGEHLRILGHGQLPNQGTACPGRLTAFMKEVARRT